MARNSSSFTRYQYLHMVLRYAIIFSGQVITEGYIAMSNVNGSSWIRREKRYAIYMRDEFTCCYCGRDVSRLPAKYRTLDHVVARENGGCNGAHNLVTCCTWCNSSKQDTPIDEFVTPEIAHHIYLQINKGIDRKAGARVAEAYRMQEED